MNILITGAASALGRAVAERLSGRHTLRLTDRLTDHLTDSTGLSSDCGEVIQSQLGDGKETSDLVASIDTIIHDPGAGSSSEADWLDSCTRRTYNLFIAAAEAGVGQVIYISTLDLLAPYAEDLAVTEAYRPLPSTDCRVMGPYLGEFIAEEFCQLQEFRLVCLRLGHLVSAGDLGDEVAFDPMWLDISDAAQGIAAAVDADLKPFDVIHLQSASARARFGVDKARSALGFDPAVDFAEIRA